MSICLLSSLLVRTSHGYVSAARSADPVFIECMVLSINNKQNNNGLKKIKNGLKKKGTERKISYIYLISILFRDLALKKETEKEEETDQKINSKDRLQK